jgi:bifunctional non-homologous end joining protein LigD
VTEKRTVRAGRRTIEVSRPDKVLFPGDGITKADLVDHYLRVADVMLPHVRGRPVSMKRYPDGIEGPVFYQKRVPAFFPDWIPRVKVRTAQKGPQVHAVIRDRATLAFLANQACIEPHTWVSRVDALDHPDLLVFDLDPSADDLGMVRRGARALRAILERAGLVPFVKTSGSKGFHVVAPLDRSADYGAVRAFADGLAEVAAARHPNVFTIEFRKAKRRGRVFLDVMRNGYGATVIPPYAVRAFPGAPVAVPIEWDELGRVEPRTFTIATMARRLSRRGDPWAGIRRRARALGDPDRRLARIRD